MGHRPKQIIATPGLNGSPSTTISLITRVALAIDRSLNLDVSGPLNNATRCLRARSKSPGRSQVARSHLPYP